MMLGRRVRAIVRMDVSTTRALNNVSIPVETKKRGLPQLRPDQFKTLANSCLSRVEGALEPLHPPVNNVFVVSRTSNPDTLVLSLAAHEFQLKVLSKPQKIELESPISGTRSYVYNAKTRRWQDHVDGHDLEGLLTRDLMRLCTGVPGF